MTKEPIIINDVDVAECENLYTTNLPIGNDKIKCGLHQGIGKTCNDYPNCYFKQLQRKEQEREELKKNYFTVIQQRNVAEQQLDQLKAELKEFKDMAKQGLDNYKDVGGCWGCGISFSFDELLKSYKALETKNAILKSNRMNMFEHLDIVQKNNIYKQALQEIKEIAKDAYKNDELYQSTGVYNEILQKCEVIDD